jgi:hypothetical protein
MPNSRNIEVGKQQRRPLPGNGSTSVFPLQLITRNKINVLPKNENTFPLQRTETELLDSEATLANVELKTKENIGQGVLALVRAALLKEGRFRH